MILAPDINIQTYLLTYLPHSLSATADVLVMLLLSFSSSLTLCVSDWDENLTEDQARKSYDKMLRIEEDFGDLFTGYFQLLM